MTDPAKPAKVEQLLQETLPAAIAVVRELLKSKDERVRLEAGRILLEAVRNSPKPPDPLLGALDLSFEKLLEVGRKP